MKCNKCQIEIWGKSKFCSNCGEPVEAAKPSTDKGDENQVIVQADWSDAASKITQKLSASFGNKRIILGIGVALIALIAFLVIFKPGSMPQAKPVTYSEVITKATLDGIPQTSCVDLANTLDNYKSKSELEKLKTLAKTLDTKDFSPRQALAYANKYLKGYSSAESNFFQIAIEGAALPILESTLQKLSEKLGPGADVKALSSEWKTGWTTDLLERCDLKDSYYEKKTIFTNSDSAISKVQALSNSVPWYPDGFNQYTDENIAWKWSNQSCGYLSCFHLKVVTKTGCPGGLYAEVNELDGAGNVIGFTNDTLGSLNPGVVAILTLTIVDDATRTGQISKISCY